MTRIKACACSAAPPQVIKSRCSDFCHPRQSASAFLLQSRPDRQSAGVPGLCRGLNNASDHTQISGLPVLLNRPSCAVPVEHVFPAHFGVHRRP